MRQKSGTTKEPADQVIKDIRRAASIGAHGGHRRQAGGGSVLSGSVRSGGTSTAGANGSRKQDS